MTLAQASQQSSPYDFFSLCFAAPGLRIGEANGPFLRIPGIHFKKSRALKSARRAVLNTANDERLVIRTHEIRTRPFAAPVVVDGMHIDELARHGALEQRFARLGGDRPPSFRGPALRVLVPDRHADPAGGGIAQLDVGKRYGHSKRHGSQNNASTQRGAGGFQAHPEKALELGRMAGQG